MPSLHEQTIYNFIELLHNQSSLFSDEDRAYLDKLITSQPRENLSAEIRTPGTNRGKKPPVEEKHPQQELLNAIQQSSTTFSAKSPTSGS